MKEKQLEEIIEQLEDLNKNLVRLTDVIALKGGI